MASSHDALAKNLTKEQCKNIGNKYSRKQLYLLLRKGVYAYDYTDSKLNELGISNEDYLHVHTAWREFGCTMLRDYNVSGVLLLADVFENFRDVCMKNYRLDPAWYLHRHAWLGTRHLS